MERLAVVVEQKRPQFFRAGYLKTLPADYAGQRHVVIVKREPSGAPGNFEWCEFEERPGPASLDAQDMISKISLDGWNNLETRVMKTSSPAAITLQFFSPENVVTNSVSLEVDLPARLERNNLTSAKDVIYLIL